MFTLSRCVFGFITVIYCLDSVSCVYNNSGCVTVPTKPGGPVITQITRPVTLAEGPYWDADKQALFFVDITGFFVYKYVPSIKELTAVYIGQLVSFVISVKDTLNQYFIGRKHDLVRLIWNGFNSTGIGNLKILTTVDQDKPNNLINDAKPDATGRLWTGTTDVGSTNGLVSAFKSNQGTLFRLSKDTDDNCELDPIVSPVSVSDGIAWSLNNTRMYYNDQKSGKVDVFDYDIDIGTVDNRRTLFDLAKNSIPGYPNGLTIDSNGYLWVVCYDGGRVIKVDPDTRTLMDTIMLPVTRPTSAIFGGVNFDILFVTTSRYGLTQRELQDQPGAGAVFAVTNTGSIGQATPSVNDCPDAF